LSKVFIIIEQDRYSFETGATYRLVIQNLVFFSSALIVLNFLTKEKTFSEKLILTPKVNFRSKFTAIYLNLLLFLIPFLTTVKISFNKISKRTIKHIFSAFIVVLIVIGVVFNLSVKEYTKMFGKDEAISFTFYRIFGLQGHVWWGTDYFSQKLSSYEKEQILKNELDVILLKSDGKYTSGLNELMLLVSPNIGASFIENGISFTMVFPALLSTLFNPMLKILVLIVLGLFFGCFVYLFYKSIVSVRLLNILILGYIYIYGIIQFFLWEELHIYLILKHIFY